MLRILYILLQIGLVALGMGFLKNRTIYDFFERLARSVVYVTLINIGLSMFMAILGCYSLGHLLIADVLIAVCFLFGILNNKELGKQVFSDIKDITKEKYTVICFLLISILYFAFPTNYMLGGRDPGLYYLNGIHISQTGAYQYETDEFLNENQELLSGIVTPGYPGIYSDYEYGYSESLGDLTPQFMPMYASAMAIGYDLGGISSMIRVNGWITILSLLILFLFLRRNFSRKIGLISVLLLAVSPAELWYGRNSVSEILLQLLIFLSFDLFATGFEKEKLVYGIGAGFLLGIGAMDRIDAYILGVGLMSILFYTLLFSNKKEKYAFFSTLSYCVMAGLSFLYGIIFSKQYFYVHMRNMGSLSKILLLDLGMLVVLIVIYCIRAIYRRWIRKKKMMDIIGDKNYVFQFFDNSKAVSAFFGLLLFVWGYAYFIRPLGISPDDGTYFEKHNITELSWYVSPLVMVLSILGLTGILYKKAKKQEHIFLFLAIGLSNYIGYGIKPYISKDHIWAARRWVTIIIPFLIILGVLGIQYLCRWFTSRNAWVGRGICLCMVVGIFGFYLYQSKTFIVTKIMNNLDTQMGTLAEQLEDDELYITNNEEIASYLHYVYMKRVYYSNMQDMEAIESYIQENEELYYIGNYVSIEMLECSKELILFFETKGQFLDKTIASYPQGLYERTREASIYRLYNTEE